MKYIIVYKAKRKNAKRHVWREWGKTVYFNTIDDAKKNCMFDNKNYVCEIMTANYKPVKNRADTPKESRKPSPAANPGRKETE